MHRIFSASYGELSIRHLKLLRWKCGQKSSNYRIPEGVILWRLYEIVGFIDNVSKNLLQAIKIVFVTMSVESVAWNLKNGEYSEMLLHGGYTKKYTGLALLRTWPADKIYQCSKFLPSFLFLFAQPTKLIYHL